MGKKIKKFDESKWNKNLSARSNACKLTDKLKAKLIASSPYSVDDVTIDNCIYTWYISNKKYIFKARQVKQRSIASTEVPVETEEELAPNKTDKLNKKENIQSFSAILYSGVSSLASTDKTSGTSEKAVSSLGYGIGVVWSHLWTKRVSFFAIGTLKKFDFKTSSARSLSEASSTQSYIGTGLNIKLGDRFTLTPGLGMGESLILNSDGGTQLSIDKISIPTISLGTKVKLYKFKSGFSFDLNLRGGILLPTSQKGYKSEQGQYYNLSIGSNYDLNGKNLFINTGITNRELEVGDAKQISKDLGISVGVGWSF